MGQRQNYRTTAEPATHSAVVVAVMFAERFNAEKGEEAETGPGLLGSVCLSVCGSFGTTDALEAT